MNVNKIFMKKQFYFLFFIISLIKVYSQEKNIDVFILFDSSHKEMYNTFKKVNDSVSYNLFSIEKLVPKEKYTKSIFIDDEGKLSEGVVGTTSYCNVCCKLDLLYVSDNKKKSKILKIETNKRLINYETIRDIKFSNFKDILNMAKNIFIVIEDTTDFKYYLKYKVKL